jgi:hypothetical protein
MSDYDSGPYDPYNQSRWWTTLLTLGINILIKKMRKKKS